MKGQCLLRRRIHFEGRERGTEKQTPNTHHQHRHLRVFYFPFRSKRHGNVRRTALLQDLHTRLLQRAMQGVRLEFQMIRFPTRFSHVEASEIRGPDVYAYILSLIRCGGHPHTMIMYFVPYSAFSYFYFSIQGAWLSMWLAPAPRIEG